MKYNFIILTFCYMLMVVGCVNHSPSLSDYFPLEDDSKYTYQGSLDDGRIDIGTIVVRSHQLPDGIQVYYFDDGNGISFCDSNMFGSGLYLFDKSGLWTIESAYEDELENLSISDKHLLIGSGLQAGTTFPFHDENLNPMRTLFVEGFQDVRTPAGEFKNCLKLQVTTKWPDGKEYKSFVWLAEDIGLVKWHRSSGRVDELIEYLITDGKEGAWSISERVRALAQEAGIKQIHNLGFGSSHPLTGTTIYFSVYGDENVENSKGTIKRFSGSLDGETESFLSTKIFTEHFVEIAINETKARIHVDECDFDIAEGILKRFYALPHRCNCDTEDAEWHWCSNEAPEDLVPHFFAWDRENDEYQLWFSTGKNSGEGLRFKIIGNMIVIIETSSWVS